MASDEDSFSSDDDSDDDFLTNAGDGVDREAIVRKKLLESFYGKATVEGEDVSESPKPSRDGARRSRSHRSREESGNVHDLDSPAFDPVQHSVNHISSATTHQLLETEERLALQVRNLDSTMQTLVYENYSRFIDATDAIRSIGVNVEANESGLKSLNESMSRVCDRSRKMDEALMGIRDQVAEKIRIQRLMARLDALLKLPATLQKLIAAGQFRNAATSYLNTASILAKHSEGFESLKSIETQCNSILEVFTEELHEKIWYWSGSGKSLEMDKSEPKETSLPKTMMDIFECVGALSMLTKETGDAESHEELISMSMTSAMRLLDRILDTHMIEVEERRFGGSGMGGLIASEGSIISSRASLIPKDFLNSLLDGGALFMSTFCEAEATSSITGYLTDFVTESFSSFISHVRVVLLEESSQRDETEDNTDEQGEITSALSILVQSVQDLEIGLIDVGVPSALTSKMVNQVLDLTESMVRRRVDHKFRELQVQVVQDCLCPFAAKVGAKRAADGLVLEEIVQMSTRMLSDCLQLVDDTVRSTVVETSTDDLAKVRNAAHSSAMKFSAWLANAIEILAGGQLTADIVEVPFEESDADESNEDDKAENSLSFDGEGLTSDGIDSGVLENLYNARDEIWGEDKSIHSDFALAMVVLCRSAAISVTENINQSFGTHLGGSAKKKARGMFPGDETRTLDTKKDQDFSIHFNTAASYLLKSVVVREAEVASDLICVGFAENAMKLETEELSCPSEAAKRILEIAKRLRLRCSSLFDCPECGGPVPKWNEDFIPSSLTVSLGRKTGLQLDVERMFKENVTIYDHPKTVMGASADSALFLFFKVVFRSTWESVRSQTFAPRGYQQCFLDALFLKHMIPHYVSAKFSDGDVQACSALCSLADDVVEALGDRCTDSVFRDDVGAKEQVARLLRDQFEVPENQSDVSFLIGT